MKFKVGDRIKCKIVKSYYTIAFIEKDGYRLTNKGFIPFENEDKYEHINSTLETLDNNSYCRKDLEAELEELETIAFENHEYPEPWLGFDADMACY